METIKFKGTYVGSSPINFHLKLKYDTQINFFTLNDQAHLYLKNIASNETISSWMQEHGEKIDGEWIVDMNKVNVPECMSDLKIYVKYILNGLFDSFVDEIFGPSLDILFENFLMKKMNTETIIDDTESSAKRYNIKVYGTFYGLPELKLESILGCNGQVLNLTIEDDSLMLNLKNFLFSNLPSESFKEERQEYCINLNKVQNERDVLMIFTVMCDIICRTINGLKSKDITIFCEDDGSTLL